MSPTAGREARQKKKKKVARRRGDKKDVDKSGIRTHERFPPAELKSAALNHSAILPEY